MDELINDEKVNIFINSTKVLVDELDMGVEQTCSLLLLLAEKYWVTNRNPPFLDFMKNCEQYIQGRDL